MRARVRPSTAGLSPATPLPATSFVYQTTNPATNTLTGSPEMPATIAPGRSQTFLVAFTPQAAFGPTDVAMNFQCCQHRDRATTFSGINTLLLTASNRARCRT